MGFKMIYFKLLKRSNSSFVVSRKKIIEDKTLKDLEKESSMESFKTRHNKEKNSWMKQNGSREKKERDKEEKERKKREGSEG